jgi:hypothetical protein
VDGAKRASGIQINDVMGVTIGPGGYVSNSMQVLVVLVRAKHAGEYTRTHEEAMPSAAIDLTNLRPLYPCIGLTHACLLWQVLLEFHRVRFADQRWTRSDDGPLLAG